MIVRAKVSALKQGHWYEYLVRFGFGGLATVVAGLVAGYLGTRRGRIVFGVSGHLLRERPPLSRNTSVSGRKTRG